MQGGTSDLSVSGSPGLEGRAIAHGDAVADAPTASASRHRTPDKRSYGPGPWGARWPPVVEQTVRGDLAQTAKSSRTTSSPAFLSPLVFALQSLSHSAGENLSAGMNQPFPNSAGGLATLIEEMATE